jgi:hypothetical protein
MAAELSRKRATRVTFRLTQSLRDRLVELAARDNRTLSNYIETRLLFDGEASSRRGQIIRLAAQAA